MNDSNEKSQELADEVMPLPRNPRRQRQQLRFAEEEEEEEKQKVKSPTSFKPPGRATRFLSIYDPSLQSPGASLRRLQQLRGQVTIDTDELVSGEIPDELLNKLPFKYNQ